jgi:uncharacterized protein (TIGR02145 family)
MKRVILLILTTMLICFFTDSAVFAQVNNTTNSSFETVKIGTQSWMLENLRVSHFRNGDEIPQARTKEEWQKAGEEGKPVWCYYDDDPDNDVTYGKLYNWYAVHDTRGLAPQGWHVPSDAEWTNLSKALGGDLLAGPKMKSTNGWKYDGAGTNASGFNAFPGGKRSEIGAFSDLDKSGNWWSSTQINASMVWIRFLDCRVINVARANFSKNTGLSVRCLKN